MDKTTLLIQLTLVHFIADFMLQNDWMATNKSKNDFALLVHSICYAIPFLVFLNTDFVIYLMISHFLIDGLSSRATTYFWKKEDRHNFFVVIGFDQWVHFLVILLGMEVYLK